MMNQYRANRIEFIEKEINEMLEEVQDIFERESHEPNGDTKNSNLDALRDTKKYLSQALMQLDGIDLELE